MSNRKSDSTSYRQHKADENCIFHVKLHVYQVEQLETEIGLQVLAIVQYIVNSLVIFPIVWRVELQKTNKQKWIRAAPSKLDQCCTNKIGSVLQW